MKHKYKCSIYFIIKQIKSHAVSNLMIVGVVYVCDCVFVKLWNHETNFITKLQQIIYKDLNQVPS